MAEIEVYVSAAPVRVDVSGAQGPAGIDDPQSAFSTNKASITNDDRFAMLDSASANIPKHTLWSLIKSTLKTYFDSIYHTTGGALGTPASGNLANCTFPTLNQNTTGNAATVTTINGKISAGSNVTLSGSGTAASPYVIAASGGGGGGSSAWGDLTDVPPVISGTTASFTTEQETKLAGIEEGATADQDLSGLAPLANPTFTGTVTIPAGASIDGYLTSATAASTYAPISTKGIRSFATEAALLAAAPEYIGQLAYQEDQGTFWTGGGLTVGAWGDGIGSSLVTATSQFIGPATGLTNIPAANLTGNIARARIDNALSANAAPIVATTVTASGAVTASGSGSDSTLKIGAVEAQSLGVNNCWAADNIYYNGSAFKYRASGFGNLIYFTGSGFNFYTAPSGSAGATASLTSRMTVGNDGTVTATAITAGKLTASGTITEGVYTVATTPTHSLGASIRINNATGATIGGVVAGTGSQHVVARSNGTQWICTAIIIP